MSTYQRKAHGKFLLTAEYAVLDGATGLAVPLNRGQWLEVKPSGDVQNLLWQSLDQDGQTWFSVQFDPRTFSVIQSTDEAVSERLRQILQAASAQRSTLTLGHAALDSLSVTTRMDFDRAWGFGTSSTLIALVADWLSIDPYRLLHDSFGGSGYDVACAFAEQAILYQRKPTEPAFALTAESATELATEPAIEPFSAAHVQVQPVGFKPPADGHFYFVYLNQKMNSRDAIKAYRATPSSPDFIAQINALTQAFLHMRDFQDAVSVITAHEALMAARLQQTPVQQRLFSDFPGAIKSMGAWGGDFVLAATHLPPDAMRRWCIERQYTMVFEWDELVS